MNRFAFWQKWLLGVSVYLVAFGVVLAVFPQSRLMNLALNNQIDPAFWAPSAEMGAGTARFQAWIYGVLGATVAGWGVLLAFISHFPFKAKERWAWNAIAAGIGLWYVLDTPLSAYHGVSFNLLFNTALLLLIAIPLAATRKAFAKSA